MSNNIIYIILIVIAAVIILNRIWISIKGKLQDRNWRVYQEQYKKQMQENEKRKKEQNVKNAVDQAKINVESYINDKISEALINNDNSKTKDKNSSVSEMNDLDFLKGIGLNTDNTNNTSVESKNKSKKNLVDYFKNKKKK